MSKSWVDEKYKRAKSGCQIHGISCKGRGMDCVTGIFEIDLQDERLSVAEILETIIKKSESYLVGFEEEKADLRHLVELLKGVK